MKISWALFRFPFDDVRWKAKALIGALLAMVGIVVWPLYLPVMGYGVRIMRATAKGEDPYLPEWDDFWKLVGDGLRFYVVSIVYALPAWLPMCCGFLLFFAAFPLMGAAAEQSQAPELAAFGIGGTLAAFALGAVLIGIASFLGLFLGFFSLAAQTHWVATGSLGNAFEFGEVWRLVRAGFSNYLLAFAVWYGVVFFVSMLASFLVYTIILACLYPFLLGAMTLYSAVLMGALYGMAYHHTLSGLSSAGEPAPA